VLRQNKPTPQSSLQHTRAPPPTVGSHTPEAQPDPSVQD
jgi:hypothetical protein